MSSQRACLRATLLSCALFSIGAATAAEPLTLAQALARASQHHPDLRGFAAEQSAWASQRAFASRSPAPEIGVLLEDAAGSGTRSGLDSAQWTLSFTQAIEAGGQRAARLDSADAKRSALEADQVQRRREALADVAQRFIKAAVDAERLRLADEQLALENKTLRAATARVESARAPIAERSRAKAAVTRAVLEREHAEHEEQSARVALAVGMGSATPDFGVLEARLFQLPPLRPLEELRLTLAQSPAARARLAQVAAHETQARGALASAGWRPTVSGGVRRYEDGNDVGFLVGFTVPLGQRARARDEADTASALAAQSRAEDEAAQLKAYELLFDRYQELGHARHALRLLEQDVLPALDEALQQTQIAYDRGRYGYLEVAQVIDERAEAQRERLDTAARYHTLLADLERLTGEPLVSGTSP